MQYLIGLHRNYVVLPRLGLAYGRVPKAANSTIKRHLARYAGLEDRFPDGFSKDRAWTGLAPDAYLVTAAELKRRYPDVLVFSFVREPLARLFSCYRSKIERPDEPPKSFLREGLTRTTSFREFALHVAARPDWRSNVHYRSQAHLLTLKGAIVPEFIGRFERLQEDWSALSALVEARGGAPLPPAPIKKRLPRYKVAAPGDGFDGDAALMAKLRARFADDYRLFYPETDAASVG